jgi:hypothetical protein
MDNSTKIGGMAGLIAGIIASLVAVFIQWPLLIKLALPFYYVPIYQDAPDISFSNLVAIEIIISTIWGTILGIIYSKIYDSIPGKDVLKGFVYGLGIYLILAIRSVTFYWFYGDIPKAISLIFTIIVWVTYGLILGILYKFLYTKQHPPKKGLRIIKHDIKNGIHPGAIAGLVGGTIMWGIGIVGGAAGLWPPTVPDPDFWFILSQTGAHVLFNMIWGIVFGILFVMFYKNIPSKGISKGIVFGLTVYFITTLRGAIGYLAYGYLITFYTHAILSLCMFFIVGLVLGHLYKPPK